MWFKTAILYRIHQPPQLAADALASALEEHVSRHGSALSRPMTPFRATAAMTMISDVSLIPPPVP